MLVPWKVEGVPPPKKMVFHGTVGPGLRLGIVAQLPEQRLRVLLFGDAGGDVRVEVAVGALADAIGDVDVEGEGSRHVSVPYTGGFETRPYKLSCP